MVIQCLLGALEDLWETVYHSWAPLEFHLLDSLEIIFHTALTRKNGEPLDASGRVSSTMTPRLWGPFFAIASCKWCCMCWPQKTSQDHNDTKWEAPRQNTAWNEYEWIVYIVKNTRKFCQNYRSGARPFTSPVVSTDQNRWSLSCFFSAFIWHRSFLLSLSCTWAIITLKVPLWSTVSH